MHDGLLGFGYQCKSKSYGNVDINKLFIENSKEPREDVVSFTLNDTTGKGMIYPGKIPSYVNVTSRHYREVKLDIWNYNGNWEIPIHSVHGLLGQFSPALGMSRDEIEGYGLHWQEELFTEPFITDWVLDRMFGEQAGYVRNTFLEHKHDGFYRMKPEYDTQRKVEAWFLNEELRMKNEESASNGGTSTTGNDSSLFTLH